MAENVKQVYDSNPSTTVADDDLFYVGKSPYAATDDSAIKYSSLLTQLEGTFVKTTGAVVTGAFPIYDPDGQNIKSSTIVTDSQLNISTPRSITLLEDANSGSKVPRLSQVQALIPTMFAAQDTVYVDPDGNNGNSGIANAPYADPYAVPAGTTTNRKLAVIQSGEYKTTSYSLKPNVSFSGYGIATKPDVTNTITLDASWATAGVGSITTIDNLWWENSYNLDFSSAGAGKVVIFKNSILGTMTVTGAASNVPVAQFNNCDLGTCVMESASSSFYNCQWSGSNEDITIQSSGSGGNSSYQISNCFMGSGTDVLISGASGSTTSGRIFASPIRGTLTLDTTFATLSIDACSMPAAGVTLTNGALISQITPVGNAPFKSLNNAYTAQNYIVPVAITSTSNSTAWNLNTAPSAKSTLTENTTIASPSNQIEGSVYILKLVQDSTPRTVAYNSVFKFPQGVVPVMSTGSGAVDIYTFYSDGTNMRCIGISQNIS